MYTMTGLDSYDWLMLTVGVIGLAMFWWASRDDARIVNQIVRAVTVIAATATFAISLLYQPARYVDTLRALVSSPAAILVLAAIFGIVAIVVIFLFEPTLGWFTKMTEERLRSTRFDAATVFVGGAIGIILAFSLAGLVVGTYAADRRPEPPISSPPAEPVPPVDTVDQNMPTPSAPFELGWSVQLDGPPMDMAFDEVSGHLYLTVADGRILRFDLNQTAAGEQPKPTTVATDLLYPRGVAVTDDRLFVVELRDVPCPPASARCTGYEVFGDLGLVQGEVRLLEEARGRIVEFTIANDGTLTRLGTLLDDLPVANSDHAVNSMVIGDDGSLYVTIGHIDHLIWEIAEYEKIVHPNKDLLGTVLRVDIDSGSYEVVGEGLRNVYGITIDPLGAVWGTDNDGSAIRGVRREELQRMVDGSHFGYPYDGSAPPFVDRTEPPAYTLGDDINGSSGIQWVREVNGRSGVLLGSGGRISFLALNEIDGAMRVSWDDQHSTVVDASGWVVAIESVEDHAVVFAEFGPNRIHLLGWVPDSDDS